jgi:hypothetical protein
MTADPGPSCVDRPSELLHVGLVTGKLLFMYNSFIFNGLFTFMIVTLCFPACWTAPLLLVLLDLVQLLTRLYENSWVQNSSVPFVLELHIGALG